MLLVLIPGQAVASAATSSSPAPKTANASSSTPYAATGYFSVAKKGNGWTLVTPQGQPFYASGIDTVSPDGSGVDQVTGVCPYCQTVANDFPNTAAWSASTVSQIRSWGFNSLGPYSDDNDLKSQMPYEVQLSMASGDDWFAPSFVTNADDVAQTQVAPLANDPNVIGYFTDSELDWGPLLGTGSGTYISALAQYLQLPAGSPGLAVAQQYVGNPSGFLTALATRYFSVTTAAVHMYDTNHLILGVKAEGQEIEPNLIKAAAPYVNVFSIEDYVLFPGGDQAVQDFWPAYLPVEQNLADLEAVANIPLMIGEYQFSSFVNSTGDPDTVPGIYQVASSQQQRANEFENFIAPLYEDTPALVGDDWFQYVDEPANGRAGDGENFDFGMIDVNGNPYPTMVSAMQLMHNVAADQAGDNGPVCDSWAAGSSGVTCSANMPSSTASPLTIVTTSLPEGSVGNSYFFGGVYAAGGTPDYSYAVTQGSLPNGLTLDPTSGIISGTPTLPGTTSFTVQASDSGGSSPVTQVLSITVAPGPLSITTTSLTTAYQNESYSDPLAATGGTAPYNWTITAGSLPSGLTLSSGGVISGAATVSGTFNFTVQATDSTSPTAETASANLTLSIPPATSVLVPSAGATVQGSALLDASASSQNGIASVQFELSGGSINDKVIGTGASTPYGWIGAGNTTAVPNGTYTLQSVATDNQGLSSTSAPITVTVDNSPPTTSVLIPSAGATVSGRSATLDAGASANVASVSFELSGGAFNDQVIASSALTPYGWIGSWNTTAVPNGTYTLQSVATYAGGVSGTSAAITVTVDNSPPTTSVLIPSAGATVSGRSATLDAGASANVASVSFELSGGAFNDQVIASSALTPYGWIGSWNTTAVPNGTYTLQSVATYAGGVSGTSAAITVTVNNSPPTTSVLIPSAGATVSGRSATLDAGASANVASVSFELSGGAFNDQVIASSALTPYGWIGSWNTTAVPNGTYTLQSVATYAGGVSGTSAPITVTVNNSPPTTSVLIPSAGATVSGGSATLDAGASANVASVSFELSGGAFNDQVIASSALTPYGWIGPWNTTAVPNGTYTLQSVASYANGASGTSAAVTVTVNN